LFAIYASLTENNFFFLIRSFPKGILRLEFGLVNLQIMKAVGLVMSMDISRRM
jgi:hypothetical protein